MEQEEGKKTEIFSLYPRLTFSWDQVGSNKGEESSSVKVRPFKHIKRIREERRKEEGIIEVSSIVPKIIGNENPLKKYEHCRNSYKATEDPAYLVLDTGIYTVDLASPEERKQLYSEGNTLEYLVNFKPSPEGIIWKLLSSDCKSDFEYYGEVAQSFSTDALTYLTKEEQAICMALYRDGFSLEKLLSMKGVPSIYTRTFFEGNTVNRKKDYTSGRVKKALLGNAFQDMHIAEMLNLYSYLFSNDTINRLNAIPNFDNINEVLNILDEDEKYKQYSILTNIYSSFRALLTVRPTIEGICSVVNPYPPINCMYAVKVGAPLDSDPEEDVFKHLTDQEKMWYMLNSDHRDIVQIFELDSYADVMRMSSILIHFLKNNDFDNLDALRNSEQEPEEKQMIMVTKNSPIKDCVQFLRLYEVTMKEKEREKKISVIAHFFPILSSIIPTLTKEIEYTVILNGEIIAKGRTLSSEEVSQDCTSEEQFIEQITKIRPSQIGPVIFSGSTDEIVKELKRKLPKTHAFNVELDKTEKRFR